MPTRSAAYEGDVARASQAVFPVFREVGELGVSEGHFAKGGDGDIFPYMVPPTVVVHGVYHLDRAILAGYAGIQFLHIRGELRKPDREGHNLAVSAKIHDFSVVGDQKRDQYGYDKWPSIGETKSPIMVGPKYDPGTILKFAMDIENFVVKKPRKGKKARKGGK